jgi:hypothetical protein
MLKHLLWMALVVVVLMFITGGLLSLEEVVLGSSSLSSGNGKHYFVAPNGNDNNPGTEDAPWASLEKASKGANPGDTVIFLPGEYKGSLMPKNSGTQDAPITFRTAERRSVKLVGDGTSAYIINLSNVSHIKIEGFHIQPGSEWNRWLLVSKASYISIVDCLMEDARGGMPFWVTESQQVQLRDNVIRAYSGSTHNMARFSNNKYILLEGNAISRAGHSPLQFYPVRSNQYVVVRGNVIHAGWGRAFEFFGDRDVLFEGNIVTNSFNGGRSGSAGINFYLDVGIFRFNRVFRNWGGVLYSGSWLDDLYLRSVRFYNNVFDHNFGPALTVTTDGQKLYDLGYINNIFYRNDPHGGHRQLTLNNSSPDYLFFSNNIVTSMAQTQEQKRSIWQRILDGIEGLLMGLGERKRDDLKIEPGFVDLDNYDHGLSPESQARNAGRHLTVVVGSGNSNVLPVKDALYFYDGFGIVGEVGDLIAVGSGDNTARILSVDRDKNQLVLDRTVTWKDGDPVGLPWGGEAPDLGVYEYGEGARPSVQVQAMPFLSRPGEEITIKASLYGIEEPVSAVWHLGDGTIAEGLELVHIYHEASDYPIRVRVTDAQGYTYMGTGYIVVEKQRGLEEPFMHTTFVVDDEEWWWRWQSYRPSPTIWARDVDPKTGNGVLDIFAPAPQEGIGTIPAWVFPVVWDIDKYPIVEVRYRVAPGLGTPVGLWIGPFPDHEGKSRRVYVALSPSVIPAPKNRVGNAVLIDDGKWHELTIDTRIIRELHPNVKVIEGMGFDSAGRTPTYTKGPVYSLDEVIIKSELK